MPARSAKKRAPQAPRKKVLLHAFYLLQPFVQFFALVAVMLVLARCSPLAPSTDRSGAVAPPPAGSGGQASQEAEIQASLQEMNSASVEVISATQLSNLEKLAPSVNRPLLERDLKRIYPINGQKRKNKKVLLLPLTGEEQDILLRDGVLRIDLAEKVKAQSQTEALKLLLQNLSGSMESKEIGAAVYMALPDATMRRVNGAFGSLNMSVKVSLGIPSEERAYIEILREAEDPAHSQDNAALLGAALTEGAEMAILLE